MGLGRTLRLLRTSENWVLAERANSTCGRFPSPHIRTQQLRQVDTKSEIFKCFSGKRTALALYPWANTDFFKSRLISVIHIIMLPLGSTSRLNLHAPLDRRRKVVVPFQRPIIKFIDWVWASCRLYGLWFIVTVRKILMSNFILWDFRLKYWLSIRSHLLMIFMIVCRGRPSSPEEVSIAFLLIE